MSRRKRQSRKKQRTKKRRTKRIRGKGLFKNIQNWFVKTGLGITPLPDLQRGLKPTIKRKGWKKAKPLQFLPRGVWKAAGVPKKTLDKFAYADRIFK